jgi:hypothetical protein
MPSRTAGQSRCWRQRTHAFAEGLAAARVVGTSGEHAIPAPSRDIDPERAHGEPDAGGTRTFRSEGGGEGTTRLKGRRRAPRRGLGASRLRAGTIAQRRERHSAAAPSTPRSPSEWTSTGSAGGDRCSSTKPAVSGGRLDTRLTAPSDESEQRGGSRQDRWVEAHARAADRVARVRVSRKGALEPAPLPLHGKQQSVRSALALGGDPRAAVCPRVVGTPRPALGGGVPNRPRSVEQGCQPSERPSCPPACGGRPCGGDCARRSKGHTARKRS